MRQFITAILFFLCTLSYGQGGLLVGNFQEAEMPTDSLVFHYSFTGNTSDESGNGHDLANNGAVLAPDRFDNENSSYYFDGTDNMNVNITNISDTGTHEISVSIWAKADTGTADDFRRMFQVDVNEFSLFKNTSDEELMSYYTASSCNTDILLIDSLWHHFVLVYDGTELKVYYDNNEVQSCSRTTGDIGGDLFIGALINGNQPWKGYLDDIRGYNRSLTTSEIDALFHKNGWTGP